MREKSVLAEILKKAREFFEELPLPSFSGNRKYRIGKFEIELPPRHGLRLAQRRYRLYDRFLPALAGHLERGRRIVDIGANVGDTAVALLQTCSNPILCVEPSEVFFPLLEKNIRSLPPDDAARVTMQQKLVGTGTLAGRLTRTCAGSASLTAAGGFATDTHTPLDAIVGNPGDIQLLKVDTDGYDFDVLLSGRSVLSASEPLLFWENEITEDFQEQGFDSLYEFLAQNGYSRVFIFDNFGNLVTEERDFSTLRHLNAYLSSMRKFGCHRTFFYTDVLAATSRYDSLARTAVEQYKEQWIRKPLPPSPS